MLIVAPGAIEAPLLARRLGALGRQDLRGRRTRGARATLLPERHWDAC